MHTELNLTYMNMHTHTCMLTNPTHPTHPTHRYLQQSQGSEREACCCRHYDP